MTVTKEIKKAADLLKLNKDELKAVPSSCLTEMGNAMEHLNRNSSEKMLVLAYNNVSDIYVNAVIDSELRNMADTTGIDYETVASLDRDTQDELLFSYWWHYLFGNATEFYNEFYGTLADIENGTI